jgi:sulfite dehydrogenase (quinone) subunit SoeC
MKPAFSVIFLTTLIGAGQGLFLALFGVEVLNPGLDAADFQVVGSLLALGLCALGLAASFWHLGRPERAWRSAAMWRSSWLSREVIALPLFMLGLSVYGLAQYLGWRSTPFVGAAAALLCLALFVCTAMVYMSIRFLQEWASALTLANFVLLGCASGFTLATLLATLFEPVWTLVPPLAWAAAGWTLAAWVTRAASLHRNARLKPMSSLQTAIGIKHPRIVQKAQGFMGGSFNTREFFHGRSVEWLRGVKWAFLLLVFPLPLLCLGVGVTNGSIALLALAFVLQYLGLLAERWFFLAQARHPQNLYYQAIS